MPSSAHSVSNLPLLFTITNCHYLSNDFMSWDAREDVFTQMALLEEAIRVADATGKHFDQNLARLRSRDGDFFNSPWRTGFLNNDSTTGRRDIR
jgi:hypothetical protein